MGRCQPLPPYWPVPTDSTEDSAGVHIESGALGDAPSLAAASCTERSI